MSDSTEINERKYHYDLIRGNESKTVDKLNLHLGFFSFRFKRKIKAVEIIYDTPNDLLSTAGIILSKQFEEDKTYFKVRKISHLPSDVKRPSKKFELAKCGSKESPRDFALQVATAINNSFSNAFTIDLSEVVKNTIPKIEITIKGNLYEINGGTGFRATALFETAIYRDITTNKKVKREGMTLSIPVDDRYKKETEDILEGIERHCKELIPYRESRFEIADRVLHPKQRGKLGIKNLKGGEGNKNENEEG